jgi:hypothetical protein
MKKIKLKTRKECAVIFITKLVEDSVALEKLKLDNDYMLFHANLEKPIIQTSRIPLSKYSSRLIPKPIKYLAKCSNLKGNIGKIIKKFSKDYSKKGMSAEDEYSAIKNLIERIFSSDERFTLEARNIQFMKMIETTLAENQKNIRDHYFHACNTMFIGFQIIDYFYDKFQDASTVYGNGIDIEFIWATTSLYHDIGYPASLMTRIISEAFDCREDFDYAEEAALTIRDSFWDRKFNDDAKILDHLYKHVTTRPNTPWVYDGFPRSSQPSRFYKSLRTAAIESGAHGAFGSLLITSLIERLIKLIEDDADREYFYRHLGISAISVLFHDPKVRKIFRQNDVNHIKIAEFPFSCLLTYVDSIQDDRRDITGLVNRPDIFKDVTCRQGAICAILNKRVMEDSIRNKILAELNEALVFFKENGIQFVIPTELKLAV